MSTLDITIIQANLRWHDAVANRAAFDSAIDAIDTKTNLIILPEMFTTGFSVDAPKLAESMQGESIHWMHRWANRKSAAICGSLIIKDQDEYFNRFVCAMPDGSLSVYDKRHLFRLADEHNHYSQGNETVVFELNGFRICPLICYDLRFPVWSRNQNSYDVLLYVANWPSARHNAWTTLLRARAIENLSYVAGVNRVGNDGNDLPYIGGSAIIDYLGNDLTSLEDKIGSATASLDLNQLNKFRDRFAFAADADPFMLKL